MRGNSLDLNNKNFSEHKSASELNLDSLLKRESKLLRLNYLERVLNDRSSTIHSRRCSCNISCFWADILSVYLFCSLSQDLFTTKKFKMDLSVHNTLC